MSSAASSKKSVKKSVAATPVAEVVVAPVAEAVVAPVQKRAAKKATAPVSAPVVVESAAAAAAAPAAAAEPAPVAAATEVAETSWHDDLTGLTKHLAAMRDTISTLFTEVKRLEKKVTRTVKDAGKRRKNRKAEAGAETDTPRRPTAFEIPQNVSDDLNSFLGQPKGTQISRANVTKRVTSYAKEHNLMNKHAINADAALLKLLNPAANLAAGETLTIFTLQKCLRNHYIKAAPVSA
jgi:chromatin remodeling complex protein RSC6